MDIGKPDTEREFDVTPVEERRLSPYRRELAAALRRRYAVDVSLA